ncbi:tissue factor pathway inhibitor [Ixodes scapularis]|uniref:tissue factor pathway inhibitor n=1 Tax=Ixodes scapularis TaxID=6945 RepID=UPI001A9EBFBF|nr:tissue factor pathway inhibitor [Ixodes scapularis]
MPFVRSLILAAVYLLTSNARNGMSKELCHSVPNTTLPDCNTRRNLVRYHYHKDAKKCKEFSIANCYESGDNFFPSMGDCIEYCQPDQTRRRCWQQHNPGFGRKHLTRWYYNNETNQCETFVYKGIYKTGNNFKHRENCIDYCSYPTEFFNKNKEQIKDLINAYETGKEEE